MKNNKNYYQILHVQPEAPLEVIRSSYRTMMQKLKMHPDLGGDEAEASLINEAYAVLMNPGKRAEYDSSLRNLNIDPKPSTKQNRQDTLQNQYNEVITTTNDCLFCQRPHNLGPSIHPDSVCGNCASPLFPAEKQAMEQTGQRAILRIGKRWPVKFYTKWDEAHAHSGMTENVSLHGILLITTIPLESGQIIKISGKPLDCVARVTNHQKNAYGAIKEWHIGMEFLTLQLHNTQGTFVSLSI